MDFILAFLYIQAITLSYAYLLPALLTCSCLSLIGPLAASLESSASMSHEFRYPPSLKISFSAFMVPFLFSSCIRIKHNQEAKLL